MNTPEQALAAALAFAFHTGEASEANAEIASVREAEAEEGREPLSYEIVVPEAGGAEQLVTHFLPKLIYFLDCRGAKPPGLGGVVTTLFVGPRLYFIRAGDLVLSLAPVVGLSPEEMFDRWGANPVQA